MCIIYIIKSIYVGFEVLIAVVMKSTIFWDIAPCSPLKVHRSTFNGLHGVVSQNIVLFESIYAHKLIVVSYNPMI
jgi:hypothetical protein